MRVAWVSVPLALGTATVGPRVLPATPRTARSLSATDEGDGLMRIPEWLKRWLRPKGKLGGPVGGPHPGPSPTSKDERG